MLIEFGIRFLPVLSLSIKISNYKFTYVFKLHKMTKRYEIIIMDSDSNNTLLYYTIMIKYFEKYPISKQFYYFLIYLGAH